MIKGCLAKAKCCYKWALDRILSFSFLDLNVYSYQKILRK